VDSKFGSSWDGWCSNESLGTYEVGLWKSIRRAGGSSLAIPNLRWVMALRLVSSTIYGVEIWPLRKHFQIYLAFFFLIESVKCP
jgi:hypothetical protein